MTRYYYSDNEADINKVLIMHEIDEVILSKTICNTSVELETRISQTELLLNNLGYDTEGLRPNRTRLKNHVNIIHNTEEWETIARQANDFIPYDVVLEDILSQDEFEHAIGDLSRIKSEFSAKVRMTEADCVFLLIADALQTLRWVLQPVLGARINNATRL